MKTMPSLGRLTKTRVNNKNELNHALKIQLATYY